MTQTDENQFIITYSLSFMLLAGVCLGLLAGVVISMKTNNIESAGTLAGYFFNLLILVVLLLLPFVFYKKRTHWLKQLHSGESEEVGRGIGQVIGLAIGGSLLASFFYWSMMVGMVYLQGSFDTSGFYTHLSGQVTMGQQFILAGLATAAALLTLWWVWHREKSEQSHTNSESFERPPNAN